MTNYETPIYKNGIDPTTGRKSLPGNPNVSTISANTELLVSLINTQIQAFSSRYPNATSQIINVKLSSNQRNMGMLRQIGGGINISNVNITYRVNNNFKLPEPPNELPSSEDYNIRIRMSGVNSVPPVTN